MGFKRSRVQIPPARCRNGMFYLYVLRSTKTGRRYVGSCEHVEKRLARIIGVNPKQPGMGRLGFGFTLRALIVVPKGDLLQNRTRSRRTRQPIPVVRSPRR